MSWRAVVVGFDGSAVATHATRWAALEAVSRNCPLHVVRIVPPSVHVGTSVPMAAEKDERLWRAYARELDAEAAACRSVYLELDVRTAMVADGPVGERLADYARSVGAGAVVVGSHASISGSQQVRDSAGAELAAATPAPVIAVRSVPAGEGAARLRVVAVCDDGATSARVLHAAFDLAGRWDADLVVVHVQRRAQGPVRGVAAHVFRRQLRGSEAQYRDVSARVSSVAAQPIQAVLSVAREAAVLVVGDRGRRLSHRLAAGTLSHAALHHARCSVVLV